VDLLRSSRQAAQPLFEKTARVAIAHHAIVFGGQRKHNFEKALAAHLADWQIDQIEKKTVQNFSTKHGRLWVLDPHNVGPSGDPNETLGHNGRLRISDYARLRDVVGAWWRAQKFGDEHVAIDFRSVSDDELRGALVGLGLAQYNFLKCAKGEVVGPVWTLTVDGRPIQKEIVNEADALVSGLNLARHLANLPGEIANPADLADFCATFYKTRPGLKVDVWDVARLKKEKMGLLLGVGQGSQSGARFVHLRYRGSKKKGDKPLAFVGKGVTFDTGGLDIKPSSGMRWMKKDMSGAATVLGLAHYVSLAKLPVNCDFYLPLAENCVSDRATRPGDVHTSRAGFMVEIDNTDAEGRLVMADAFDVAVKQKGADAPAALIDVSTLTGAMRVALGLDVAGFFANDDKLARDVELAAQKMGELAWRMPIVDKYWKQMNSTFADFKNSSDSGFGGAVTAALFLQKFVGKTPWLHFDVMSWSSGGDPVMGEGGNAQGLQILAGYLHR
jgi:leucyl aminopeptidase